MLEKIRGRAAKGFLAALTALCLPLATQAAIINIILSDMDVTYMGNMDGGTLFDAMGGQAGGTLTPANADDITTAVFELDNNIEEVLMSGPPDGDIYADLRIDGIGPTLTKGVFVPTTGNNNNSFGFDLFIDPPGANPPSALLRLTTDEVSILVSNGVFFFTGEANIVSQNLPAGLLLDSSQPVQFSFTATLPAVQAGATTNSALGSGAFTISGIAIPEPAAIGLACIGIIGLGTLRRSRSATR